MEAIARKFFEDDTALDLEGYGGQSRVQGILTFLSDNYPVVMGTYRAIEKQNILTAKKHEKAHLEIQKLRKVEDKLQKKRGKVEKHEWTELNENLAHWKKIREEDDVIYYLGKPLRDNSITQFIFKHPALMQTLENADSSVRPQIGRGVNRLAKIAIWPLKKLIFAAMVTSGPDSAGMDYGAAIYSLVEAIPASLEARLSNIDPGTTSGSNDPDIDDLGVQEVKYTM